ncbi:3-keto-5-aminohexanoate cleavage protein [Candidatus Bathyarchaeota archaeon]|nr:3-keto-5-aminohexanoate cleavage protein [Candidatus Bathyarchaeota archaeon]
MIIITVAPTGSGPMWKETPYLPITPEQIAEETVKAYEAGAAVAHIHVRNPKTKEPYPDVKLYREVIERIREKCDIIIQLTTGGGGPYGISLEQRMCALELNPEFASLNVATMTFGNGIFLNPPEAVEKIAKVMLERNIKPEVECYDVGHINLALQLFEKGLLKEPLRFGLVLGVKGGIPATPENLMHMVSALPQNCRCRWGVIAIGGKVQFKLLTLGMILGGDVRVGMEDNIYLAKGVLAKSNAELVAKVVRIAKELGMEIATPSEARKLLELPQKP